MLAFQIGQNRELSPSKYFKQQHAFLLECSLLDSTILQCSGHRRCMQRWQMGMGEHCESMRRTWMPCWGLARYRLSLAASQLLVISWGPPPPSPLPPTPLPGPLPPSIDPATLSDGNLPSGCAGEDCMIHPNLSGAASLWRSYKALLSPAANIPLTSFSIHKYAFLSQGQQSAHGINSPREMQQEDHLEPRRYLEWHFLHDGPSDSREERHVQTCHFFSVS